MEKVSRRYWLLLSLLLPLIFSACSYSSPTPEQALSRQWELVEATPDFAPEGPFYLRFNDGGTFAFAYSIALPEVDQGRWHISDSLLILAPAETSPLAEEYIITTLSATTLQLVDEERQLTFQLSEPATTIGSFSEDVGRGVLGILTILLTAFLFSTGRRSIDWRLVLTGLALQLIFALAVLKVPLVKDIFEFISSGFVEILNFTREGSIFLFGPLVENVDTFGFIFAFQVLPTIIFFSALTSLLYYLNVLQYIVKGFAWVMYRTMRLSGAESLAAAGNIFLGQTEAPLLVKPYVNQMTRSEIMALMTGGMATIAGGVLVAYIGFLGGPDPEMQQVFATHLLTASIMSAPAALLIAKIIIPETEKVERKLMISSEQIGSNVLDAIANGTTQGLKLAVNVAAMLLVFLALVAMFDSILVDLFGKYTGLNAWILDATDGRYEGFSVRFILGHLFAPFAWLMGVPMEDATSVGLLLGEKTLFNEFVAYVSLGQLKDQAMILNYKSIIIATYALCGFANFASIGIQIGGIGVIAPERRTTLSELGFRALVGGTLACFLTASIAGMIV